MDIDPDETVTVELRWDDDGMPEICSRDITRRQLGNLLLQADDMASETEATQEDAV